MPHHEPSQAETQAAQPVRAATTTLWAFLLGVPLAVAILLAVEKGPLAGTELHRYLGHAVEKVEVLLFCLGLGALIAKVSAYYLGERAASRTELLPRWDGRCVPVSQAGALRDGLRGLGRRVQQTYLVRRVTGILEFLRSRGSANDLDDQIRSLADTDSIALENSYSLIRLITWAIPILGFLGTVLGITGAISNVTPETLEKSLGGVTSGLSLAFDATAVALALTMSLMFLTFLVERLEQGMMESVDRYAEDQLAHRFERTGPEGGEFVEVVRQSTQVLVEATGALVDRQAAVWADALATAEQRWAQSGQLHQEHVTQALQAALAQTLQAHQEQLHDMERRALDRYSALLDHLDGVAGALRTAGREQEAALAQVVQGIAAQAGALARLQENEGQLVRMQESLTRNLDALAGAGAFEQAVHSLTAAIHLLTARAGAGGVPPRVISKPGAAA
jgi:biopolymer transport protein ExbB/TolQ